MNIKGTVSVSALLIAATLGASPVLAQTAGTGQEATTIDEIIVTATRRE